MKFQPIQEQRAKQHPFILGDLYLSLTMELDHEAADMGDKSVDIQPISKLPKWKYEVRNFFINMAMKIFRGKSILNMLNFATTLNIGT